MPQISYNAYKQLKDQYGHIASFAYWYGGKLSGEKAPLITVDDEAAFDTQLKGKLHTDVVFMGFNYGLSDLTKKSMDFNTYSERVHHLQDEALFENQYGVNGSQKMLRLKERELTHNTVVEGAFMTDFFISPDASLNPKVKKKSTEEKQAKHEADVAFIKEKFTVGDSEFVCPGLPSPYASGLTVTQGLIEHNVKAFKHMLAVANGLDEAAVDYEEKCAKVAPKAIVFFGSALANQKKVVQALISEFPNTAIYKIPHYKATVHKKLGLVAGRREQVITTLLNYLDGKTQAEVKCVIPPILDDKHDLNLSEDDIATMIAEDMLIYSPNIE